MNALQLVNRLRQNCGVSGSDLATIAGLSGESLRMLNFTNEAWMDIQSMREDWDWMRKSTAFPTVAGRQTYTTTQIGLTDFGFWDRDTFRNYANPTVTMTIASPCVVTLTAHGLSNGDTVTPYTDGALGTGFTAGTAYYVVSAATDTFSLSATSGGTAINTTGTQSGTHTITSNNTTSFIGFNSEVFMEYIDYDSWRDSYQFGALRTTRTRPLNMTITPLKAIGVGPFPAAGYTVIGDYYSVPSELALDADTPALPTKFHMAIIYRAMMAYGAYEAASDVYQRGEIEFGKWIRRIHADQIPEMTFGALA